MEPMSERERFAALMLFYFITMFGGFVYLDVTEAERMAKAGYQPIRMAGDVHIYWQRVLPPDEGPKEIKKF